jgi:hypothetical protein
MKRHAASSPTPKSALTFRRMAAGFFTDLAIGDVPPGLAGPIRRFGRVA